MQHVEVLTVGRSSVDVYPLETGIGLEDVSTFGKFLGGSPANVAVAARRLGRSSGVITAVGDDPFGRFIRRELTHYGVDESGVVTMPNAQTSIVFCELFPPDHFPLYFYRSAPAPDLRLMPEDLDLEEVRNASILWLTATGLSREPSREAHYRAISARAGKPTLLDLDYRPVFWESEREATAHMQRALAGVSVAVGNQQECEVATGESEPERAADALLAMGVGLAIVKRGPLGVLARTREQSIEVPATPCTAVNGLGAGDAFGGALSHGLLSGWDLSRTMRYASAAGAIVAARLSCASAMPTPDEVERVLGLGHVPDDMGQTTIIPRTKASTNNPASLNESSS